MIKKKKKKTDHGSEGIRYNNIINFKMTINLKEACEPKQFNHPELTLIVILLLANL